MASECFEHAADVVVCALPSVRSIQQSGAKFVAARSEQPRSQENELGRQRNLRRDFPWSNAPSRYSEIDPAGRRWLTP